MDRSGRITRTLSGVWPPRCSLLAQRGFSVTLLACRRFRHCYTETRPMDLKRKLKELLIERLKFEDMTPEDIGDDEPLFAGGLGLDSIDALEIVVMLESEFGIKVKNETSARDSFRSIATLAEFVESKLAAAQA